MHTRTPNTHSGATSTQPHHHLRAGMAIEKEIELEKLTKILGINNRRIIAATMLTILRVERESIKDILRLTAFILDSDPARFKRWKELSRGGQPHLLRNGKDFATGVADEFFEVCQLIPDEDASASEKKNRKLDMKLQPVHEFLLPSFKLCHPVSVSKEFSENLSHDLVEALSKFTCNLTRKLSTYYSADDDPADSHHYHHQIDDRGTTIA